MKFRAILLALVALAMISCQEKAEPSVTVNDPNLSSLSYTCLEDKTMVPINASQDWTATTSAGWITVSPTKGTKGAHFITVSVTANGPDGERTGNVQITAGSAVLTINVKQAEQTALQLGTEWVEVAQAGGEASFNVTANVDFTAKVEEGAEWLSIIGTKALKTSVVTLNIQPNNSVKSRTGKIAINGSNGLSGSVSVMQAGGKVKAFNESDVVASFGVMSDTHIDRSTEMPSSKLQSAFAQLKAEASKHDRDGLDGILIAGDLIQSFGNVDVELNKWKTIYEGAFDPLKIPLVYSMGNHDVQSVWWNSTTTSDGKRFRSIFGSSYYTSDQDKTAGESLECRHCLIKGVNVIAISPTSTNPVTYDPKAAAWLDAKLQEITSAAPDRYVLLLTHPMIHNTVYGSTLVDGGRLSQDPSTPSKWYTTNLTSILKKYPQVIAFGGHLHFPINDPCSIWQGDFTVMGCGSGRYMAFEGGEKYVNKSSATVLNDANDFSQGYLLQVDASGNIRMTRMDFFHNQTIGDAWELPFPDAAGKSHLEIFSNARRAAENEAPRLSSLEVVKGSTSLANVPCTAKWAAAQDEDFAHHYELTWTSPSGSKTVWIMSDYYLHAKPADMKKTWEYTLGSFPAGSYSATLVAVDSWGKSSAPLTTQFTVESGAPSDPGTLPAAYVDFAFDGSIRDVNGKVTVTNYGASLTSETVSVAGKSKAVPAFVTTGSTTYAMCQFKEFGSSESMKGLMLGGFTVEAFYLDKGKGDGQTHGVVCGTESGGWGLAETTDRRPYFIVGDGTSTNSYKSVYATAVSSSELTHVLATYDPSSMKLNIYINGALSASGSFSSSFFPGTGDTFNRFCLGADIKPGNDGTHYPSNSMVIVDAKIYTTALNATQAALAYDKAKKELGF